MKTLLLSILFKLLSLLNLIPQPLLDTTSPMTKTRIIIAATQLGLFEALSAGPLKCHELAVAISAQGDSLCLMLDALVGYGYLRCRGGYYRNSRMVRKYLVSSSPHFVGNMVLFQEDANKMLDSLTILARTGCISTTYDSYLGKDPERWRKYILGMRDTAQLSIKEVLAKVSVPANASRLLDLGGGHGLYAGSFCERYPQLHAVIFDRSEAISIARGLTSTLPFRERIQFQEGDFWYDNLTGKYDIVLLFALLHLFSPQRNCQLLTQVAGVMPAGGIVVIADFLSSRLQKEWSASFSLGMRCFFGEGQVYDQSTICHWLHETGFECIKVYHLHNPASLITAVKSA